VEVPLKPGPGTIDFHLLGRSFARPTDAVCQPNIWKPESLIIRTSAGFALGDP
jgi:hypothetical protein